MYLYIIDLDDEGKPTDRVLYSNTYVPVTDDAWTEFTLPAPIDCPNGYMMGIAYSGIVSLSIDNGEDFVPYVNCYCADYTTGQWYYLDDTDYKANFAFRSIAAPYGGDGKALWKKASDSSVTVDEVPTLDGRNWRRVSRTGNIPMKNGHQCRRASTDMALRPYMQAARSQ